MALWQRSSGIVVADFTALFRLTLAARLLEFFVERPMQFVKGNLFCFFLTRNQEHNGKYRSNQGNKHPVLWSNFQVLISLPNHCAANGTVMLRAVRNIYGKALNLQKLDQGVVKGHATG